MDNTEYGFHFAVVRILFPGRREKAKKNKQEEKRPGKYEQLFKGKMCTTVSSDFMTLHKVDGKLYFESLWRCSGGRCCWLLQ